MFIWKQKEILTFGDVMSALLALESREEAQGFMKAYFKDNVHAYQNVGYATGYFDRADAERIMDWCDTSHPIFGRSHVSPQEALEAGRRVAVGDQPRFGSVSHIKIGHQR